MEIWESITHLGFDLGDLGVTLGLLFTAVSLRSEIKTRRIANVIALTQNHQEIWGNLYRDSRLKRVLDPHVDLKKTIPTVEEEIFVNSAIQHLHAAYQAMRAGLLIKPEGLRQDVRSFFSLPIVGHVWRKVKTLQNEKFVNFVESCLIHNGRGSRAAVQQVSSLG